MNGFGSVSLTERFWCTNVTATANEIDEFGCQTTNTALRSRNLHKFRHDYYDDSLYEIDEHICHLSI